MQSYIVNGVRASTKKSPAKASLFQPAAMLDLIVYHNELKNLQRIKEFKWGHLYQHVLSDVLKNAVALFMVELLQKTIRQPETNAELFQFIEDSFLYLDSSEPNVVANYPLFFALHLANLFGLRFSDDYSERKTYLDLKEGEFVQEQPIHPHFLEGQYSYTTSQLLRTMQPQELNEIKLNHEMRRVLLNAYQVFYALHIQDFGTMKTLPVLKALLS